MSNTKEPRYYGIIFSIAFLIIVSASFLVSKLSDEFKIRSSCTKVKGQVFRIEEEPYGYRTYLIKYVADTLKSDYELLVIRTTTVVGSVNDSVPIHYDAKSGWAQFEADAGFDLKTRILALIIILLLALLIAGIRYPDWLLRNSHGRIFHSN